VAVPNFKSFDAKHYGALWAAYDVPIHFGISLKKQLSCFSRKEKITLKKVLPMKFDSFYVSLLSEKYKSMNYPKHFFIGLLSNFKAKQNLNLVSYLCAKK
jgi:hypothetical protein